MVDSSLYYINFEPSSEIQNECIRRIKESITDQINPLYLLKKPVIDKKADYDYQDAFGIFMPKHKIIFIDFGNDDDLFEEYIEDFTEDIGYISKKYDFIKTIGRVRQWSESFVTRKKFDMTDFDIEQILKENELQGRDEIRRGEIIISLANGSINEAERLGDKVPETVLDKIKRKIILFDGEQTKFVFDEPKKKRITIQGLAGTGKTELLLHKIKELYISEPNTRIAFTCHNVILADNLKKRVPEFFNFMKVEEQIKWEERLWVMRSWGTHMDMDSGVYSYICDYYKLPFSPFSYNRTFDSICSEALYRLNQIENFECCFDYILIDESQDFSEGFFKLCEKVAAKAVYVAGDIFQDIFENKPLTVVNPDFLLNRCYRTDPRTLMGAHAIGMGLFEKRLRWLSDDEWEACGYEVSRNDKFELRRRPLKRFEDVDMNASDGITIEKTTHEKYVEKVFQIIDSIREKNSTVTPDDIGIIFMENIEENYTLAAAIQMLAMEKYGWTVNIGYETKEKKKDTLFVSNKNNVKGLEFPFVICIMQMPLENNFSDRNSIYMMLTRSFLTSYLVIPESEDENGEMYRGVEFVNRNGYLRVSEPSEDEKKNLANAIISRTNLHKSQYDLVEEIMDELGICDKNKRKRLTEMIKLGLPRVMDRDKLYDAIRMNSSILE